ncbi:MAG TPA: CHAP domain-containing protein [Polyangiaceae bacterium]|nr:CHAP domain-containing protein [Polyangiaceae bacterium]
MSPRIVLVGAALAALASACSGAPGSSDPEAVANSRAALDVKPQVSGSSIVSLALANVGGSACGTNSLGGTHFETSCTGNGGQPEYWCADFAQWVWANSGADTTGLNAAAGSFYCYGQNNGTLSNTPQAGDAVVFDYQGGGVADHVALVTQVNSNGTIETVSGDWNGQSGTEAEFSSTSSVVLNSPAYPGTVGTSPGVMGMTISGFISPVGGLSQGYAASYVGQSFPLATTALQMTTGQTIASYIEMKNTGGLPWDSKTRLGTSNPRDRMSVFADSSWISPNRLAAVTGTVQPGSTFKFQFNLHAPDKPGTYYEYFNLVEEGVAWFSDPGQGGPPDNDLEVQVLVVAGPDAGTGSSSGGSGSSGSSSGSKGGSTSSGSSGGGATGSSSGGSMSGPGGGSPSADDAGTAGDDAGWGSGDGATGSSSGCSVASSGANAGVTGWLVMGVGFVLTLARARRRRSEN